MIDTVIMGNKRLWAALAERETIYEKAEMTDEDGSRLGELEVSVPYQPADGPAAGGDLYDFPFELSARETGGRDVRIGRVTLDIYAFGAIHVYSESYDSARIAALGYPMSIAAGSEAHYRLTPRKRVDERLFAGVSGELRIDGTDAGGNPVTASTTVTVTR